MSDDPTPPTPDPTGQPPAPPTAGDPPAPPPSDRTFTQADVDRIIADRLKRENLDDLKAAKTRLDELEAKNLSDLEREQKARADAEKARDDAIARANSALTRSAIVAAAAAAGAVDPDVVAQLVDTGAITVGDDGKVDGAAEAVAALLASKPFLKGNGPARDPDQGPQGGGTPGQMTADEFNALTDDEALKALAEGRVAHLLANPR